MKHANRLSPYISMAYFQPRGKVDVVKLLMLNSVLKSPRGDHEKVEGDTGCFFTPSRSRPLNAHVPLGRVR